MVLSLQDFGWPMHSSLNSDGAAINSLHDMGMLKYDQYAKPKVMILKTKLPMAKPRTIMIGNRSV